MRIKMSGDHQFFPSLHDNSANTSDIWSTLIRPINTPKSSAQQFEPTPWPKTNRLAEAFYQPLNAFCPPEGPCWLRPSDEDVISELGIRLAEIELLNIMGEKVDNGSRLCL